MFKKEKQLVLANIIIITTTFVILSLFLTLAALTHTAIRTLEKQAQLTVFFIDEMPEQNILNIKETLEQDSRILEVEYISKQMAYEIFVQLNQGNDLLLDSVSPEILPASLGVKTVLIEDLKFFENELKKVDGVEEIKLLQDVIDRFKYWSNIGYITAIVVSLVLLIISASIITVTIRLMIANKGKELEIMRLVGASNLYISKPLIKQAVTLALTAGMLASVISGAIILWAQSQGYITISLEFAFLPEQQIDLNLFVGILIIFTLTTSLLLSLVTSFTTTRKYLKL